MKREPIKWLTISQIKRRSKTAKGALKVSYEHWNQLYTATTKELRVGLRNENTDISTEYCGLCEYKSYVKINCSVCVLKYFCVESEGLWAKARDTLKQWREIGEEGNWHAWKRACKALRDKLKELMEE